MAGHSAQAQLAGDVAEGRPCISAGDVGGIDLCIAMQDPPSDDCQSSA